MKSTHGPFPRTRKTATERLLTSNPQEPLPDNIRPEMAVDHDPDKAASRYRAIVPTTLRQLHEL